MTPEENSLRVQEAKRVLLALLTDEEKIPRRTRVTAERDYRTFEDIAREISKSDDPRAGNVGAALAVFQSAVNDSWEAAFRSGAHRKLARGWLNRWRGTLKDVGAVTFDEIEGEVLWALRRFIVRYQNNDDAQLMTYAFPGICRWLHEYVVAALLPVEVPRQVRREFDDWNLETWVKLYEEVFDNVGAEDPFLKRLQEDWDRSWSESLGWLLDHPDEELWELAARRAGR